MCASSHLQEQPCVFDSPGSPVLICEHKDLSAFCSASVHMGRGQSENSLHKLIVSFYHVGPGNLTQVCLAWWQVPLLTELSASSCFKVEQQ